MSTCDISVVVKGMWYFTIRDNLVYPVVFPQFLIFQKNNGAETQRN